VTASAVAADERCDVLIVGGGNAGLSAALAARAEGASVLIIDAAPREWAGGNSAFTAGAFRTTYGGLDEIRPVLDLDDEQVSRIDLAPYTADDFYGDIQRMAAGRSDPTLARILAGEAADALRWLAGHGVRWELLFARQSFPSGERIRFWGNLTVGSQGGGIGLVEAELVAAERAGVPILFETPLVAVDRQDGRIVGARVGGPGGWRTIGTGAIILASGGFEADARRRAAYLGPGWDLAKVRGTPYDTGDPLFMALAAGAAPAGHWSGCHAIAWDAAAPLHGDRELTNRYSRQSYPFGIVVNRDGRRFVDEGADFRNYTYAKYGAEIMKQPGALAFQLFDATTLPLLARVDYETATSSRSEAGTVRQLAERAGIDADGLERTIAEFNAAVGDAPFDPSLKDGRAATGIVPPKSNWAHRFESPPFVAFAVTCGITFTFGGLRIDPDGRVLDARSAPLPGLYACGEIVGALFHHNYPGGSGLTAGTVFGRRAGATAAREARARSGSC
jgi:tricarballylate dehydrogenase